MSHQYKRLKINDKNDENLVANYYKKAGKEADKEVSFKTEKAE